jgi:protein TonB
MTAHCPATGRFGHCPWLALEASRRARLQGWIGAGSGAAAVLGGLAIAASLAAPAPQPELFAISLAPAMTASAPVVSVLPDMAPEVTPDMVDAMAVPETTQEPFIAPLDPAPVAPIPLADMQAPAAEIAPSVTPDPVPHQAEPATKKQQQEPAKKKPAEKAKPKQKKAKPDQSAQEQQASATGSKASSRPAAQGSANAWGNSVLKKIRKTPRRLASGHGIVRVGFVVAADGGLASAKVLKSSGDASLDAMAVDHIRRAAPFAPPPGDAVRMLSFEFQVR